MRIYQAIIKLIIREKAREMKFLTNMKVGRAHLIIPWEQTDRGIYFETKGTRMKLMLKDFHSHDTQSNLKTTVYYIVFLSTVNFIFIFMLNFIKNSIGRDAWIINDIMIKKCHQGSIDEKTGWKEAGQSLSQFLSIKHLKILARVGPILALG